jgi:hypothetical protein
MAKRRSYKRAADPAAGPAVDPDVARFASWVRAEQDRERAEKRAERDQRRQADELARLRVAKDDAAALVKRLRASSRATPAERAAADEAYRVALAALVAAETGATPSWAPPEPGADGHDGTGPAAVDGTDGPTAQAGDPDDDAGQPGDEAAEQG